MKCTCTVLESSWCKVFAPGISRVVEGEEVDWASIWSLARPVVAEVCDAALVAALVVCVWLDHVISRGKPDAVVPEAILLGARPRIEVRIEVAVDSHLVAISDFRIWEGKIVTVDITNKSGYPLSFTMRKWIGREFGITCTVQE